MQNSIKSLTLRLYIDMKIYLSNQKGSPRFAVEAGFAHLFLLLVLASILIILGLVIASKLQVVKTYPLKETGNVQGVLIAKGDDSDSGSSGSGSSGSSDSSGSSSSDDDDDDSKPDSSNAPSDRSNTQNPSSKPSVRVKTEQSDKNKVKTEIRFGKGEKIKTRVEEGRTRIDVYSGGVKVRYEIRDGRVIIKAETEEGENVPEQELFKIEDRLGRNDIKVATEGAKLLIARGSVGALSSFPLQLDLNTNELIASTPAGSKTLTILPDQAVQNLLAANVISRLDPAVLQQAAQSGGLTSVSGVIALGERNGVLAYEIAGLRDHRLLGFIPITTPVTVFVSAETGQTVAQEQPLLSTIVDLLSP